MKARAKVSGGYNAPLALCFLKGERLGSVYEQVRAAGGSLSDGRLSSAEHNLSLAKDDLERAGKAGIISMHTAKRLVKLISDPLQAVKKAMETQARGKTGRVDTGRVTSVLRDLLKAQRKEYQACSRGKVKG